MWVNGPGADREFPPWAVSAYQIAVKHGFRGTERDFRLALCGAPGYTQLPMVLVTEEPEEDISPAYEAVMRPSSSDYAYHTEKNDFLAADQAVPVPDGLWTSGQTVRLACAGEAFGTAVELPDPEDVLPSVTAADNGKVLKVASGAWAAGSL